MAFTRLLGYVKHFHPSDVAATTDWLRFVVAMLPKVEKARDSVDVNWPGELEIALSSAATDPDNHAFYRTLFRMIVALHDGHGILSGPGFPTEAMLPLQVELIEGKVVVTCVTEGAGGVQPGDVVERIDGVATIWARS